MGCLPKVGVKDRRLEIGDWRFEVGIENWQAEAVIKTLAYSAVFNYPLTKDEIFKYLIFSNFQSNLNSQFTNTLRQLKKIGIVQQKEGYYFLSKMESGVKQRRERENISQKKLSIGKKFCRWARLIPTVRLIGISGALAMRNAHENDDIDLFVVTKKETTWTTRFLLVLLADVMGIRRRPDVQKTSKNSASQSYSEFSENIKDKICLNMFVDKEHMSVPEKERDLFSAHEVVQMKPIYNSRGTYERFLWENRWVKEYLPNSIEAKSKKQETRIRNPQIINYKSQITNLFEKTVKKLQLNYMRPKVTNEVLKTGYLRFHPVDARRIVLRRYKQILTNLRRHGLEIRIWRERSERLLL